MSGAEMATKQFPIVVSKLDYGFLLITAFSLGIREIRATISRIYYARKYSGRETDQSRNYDQPRHLTKACSQNKVVL